MWQHQVRHELEESQRKLLPTQAGAGASPGAGVAVWVRVVRAAGRSNGAATRGAGHRRARHTRAPHCWQCTDMLYFLDTRAEFPPVDQPCSQLIWLSLRHRENYPKLRNNPSCREPREGEQSLPNSESTHTHTGSAAPSWLSLMRVSPTQ